MAGDKDRGRRPKRRCATNALYDSSALPSAVHYVGYVEDDETPEMIMAKFVELERIQQAELNLKKEIPVETKKENDNRKNIEDSNVLQSDSKQALTDEQLLEVFKQTSMFNVKTALRDNAMLMGIENVLGYTITRYGSEDPVSEDDDVLRSFWSDEEMEEMGGSESGSEGRSRNRRKGSDGRCSVKIPRKSSTVSGSGQRHKIVTAYNPETQAYVRRKVQVPDPDEIVQIRIPPPPLPVSWGRTVRPYTAHNGKARDLEGNQPVSDGAPPSTFYMEIQSMEEFDSRALPLRNYQAALINVGWATPKDGRDPLSSLSGICVPKLVPEGFIFIWTPKQYIHSVCKRMVKWGYVYVENLTWCFLSPNNSLMRLPDTKHFVANSHLSLYIFRMADKGRDIELRHQRNPDVVFDCVATIGEGRQILNPRESLVAIETLLPMSAGKLIEFWAPQSVKRPGWTHIVEL